MNELWVFTRFGVRSVPHEGEGDVLAEREQTLRIELGCMTEFMVF